MDFFNTLRRYFFYSIFCLCLCVSSFRAFPVSRFSCPIPAFYADIPDFYANIPCYLGCYAQYCVWCTMGGWGGFPMWLGGVYSLVCGVTLACSLTYHTDPRFQIPARILFPQGTGEPSYVDHL